MTIDSTGIAQAIVEAPSDVGNVAVITDDIDDDSYAVSRVYTLGKKLSDYADLEPHVFVIPRSETNEEYDRVDDQYDLGVGIAVIRQVPNTDNDTIDPLLELPRSIKNFLRRRDMAGCENARATIEVLFGHDELYENSCLVSTIGLNYEALQ